MRILLADDEIGLTAALQRGLSAEGFATDVVHDGLAAEQAALYGEYDAIVLDIMLPGQSGYRVVSHLRKQKIETPVLLLSAKDGEYDIAEGLDSGADDYLTKPFSFLVLVARLRALLRRPVRVRQPVLTVGSLILDPAARTLTQDGEDRELTVRELSLLEYLMSHPDRVIGKVELRDHVWDGSGEDLNVVEVYISYLRRKLGKEVVQTVRGAGYRVRG